MLETRKATKTHLQYAAYCLKSLLSKKHQLLWSGLTLRLGGWLEPTGVESLYAQLHWQIDQIESTANLHHPSLRERIRFENRKVTERLIRLEQNSISPFTPKSVGTTSNDVSPEARKLRRRANTRARLVF